MMRWLMILVVLVLGAPAHAQQRQAQEHQFLHNANPANPLFECAQPTVGQVACQAGVRCKCLYDAFGSTMRGQPPGYRWDCGLEHGTCMGDVPATTSGNYGSGGGNNGGGNNGSGTGMPGVNVIITPAGVQ